MKIRDNLLLREVAGEYVVVSVGGSGMDFNRMLVLNESGALLFRTLQVGASGSDLKETLCREYEVSEEAAERDVKRFLGALAEAGCLE